MSLLTKAGKSSSAGGLGGIWLRIVLRFLQFVLAITVAGLYGVDLDNARRAGAYTDGKWVYAEVVAGLSATTCLVYAALVCVPSHVLFAWDWVIFILWTALFGLFGRIFIPARPTPEQHGQIRMQHAVWVDLANMILWFLSAAYATLLFLRQRRAGGRSAKVDA